MLQPPPHCWLRINIITKVLLFVFVGGETLAVINPTRPAGDESADLPEDTTPTQTPSKLRVARGLSVDLYWNSAFHSIRISSLMESPCPLATVALRRGCAERR